jgi:uncharacterized DUF497 family protein
MRFLWNQSKESINIAKHGISFTDAKDALNCGLVLVLKEEYISGEDRYVYLGMCKKLNILVVVVAYPSDEITRIISARKATKRERRFYEKGI